MMCFHKGPLVLHYSRPANPKSKKTGGGLKKTGDFAKTSPDHDLITQSICR